MATYTLNRKALQAAIQAAGLTADQFTTAVGMSEEELFSDNREKMAGAKIVNLLKKIEKALGMNSFELLVEKVEKSP